MLRVGDVNIHVLITRPLPATVDVSHVLLILNFWSRDRMEVPDSEGAKFVWEIIFLDVETGSLVCSLVELLLSRIVEYTCTSDWLWFSVLVDCKLVVTIKDGVCVFPFTRPRVWREAVEL